MSHKIVRADDLTASFAQYGVGNSEDQQAIREAIAQGDSFESAAGELGYKKAALVKPAKKGKRVELQAAKVSAPTAQAVSPELEQKFSMGENVGQSLVFEKANAFNSGFQKGFTDGLGTVAAATQQLIEEGEEVADNFFRSISERYL